MDGTEYILYAPNFKQQEAYAKSLTNYKDVFDQIKADIKDDATIAKSKGDGLPKDLDHVEWAALLCFTLKKLNKTWGVNDKIWIYNKNYDGKKSTPMYLAITPKITQRNAIRGAQKVSATAAATADDDDAGYIDAANIKFGPRLPPLTRRVYTRTKNGLMYYYNTEEDAENYNHYKIENSDEELVNESGERINPDGTLMKSNSKSDDEYEYEYESDNERNDFDYNDGIPPYEGARWDYEIESWVSDPFDMDQIDEEGNYKIPPKDIIVEPEPEPEPMPMPAPAPAPIQLQESRIDKFRRLKRERMRAKNPQPDVVMPPPTPMPMPALAPAPTEAERIAEARIGLPAGWEPRISKTIDKVYYYNQTNGNKQYEVPTEDPRIVEASIGLPAGWVPLISRSTGRIYFYNQNNGVKQVERPTMGGKRTRRRSRSGPRPKSRAKQPKQKRTTKRRKRTTRTRLRK